MKQPAAILLGRTSYSGGVVCVLQNVLVFGDVTTQSLADLVSIRPEAITTREVGVRSGVRFCIFVDHTAAALLTAFQFFTDVLEATLAPATPVGLLDGATLQPGIIIVMFLLLMMIVIVVFIIVMVFTAVICVTAFDVPVNKPALQPSLEGQRGKRGRLEMG
jgi:hypothetical protein